MKTALQLTLLLAATTVTGDLLLRKLPERVLAGLHRTTESSATCRRAERSGHAMPESSVQLPIASINPTTFGA